MKEPSPQRHRYSLGDSESDGKLEEIVNACCTESERHYVHEIARTALRLGIDSAKM